MIFVRDIEKRLDLKIIPFLTTLLYVYLVSTRTQLEVYEITSSTTEIKEIFHNPAGSLLRGPPDDPSGRKIYLKLRSIQSEGRFLALDSAPRRSERKSSRSSSKLLNARVYALYHVRRYHAHVTTHMFAVASILTHTLAPIALVYQSRTRAAGEFRAAGSVDEAEER